MPLNILPEIIQYSIERDTRLKRIVTASNLSEVTAVEQIYERKLPEQYIELVTTRGKIEFDILGWSQVKVWASAFERSAWRFGTVQGVGGLNGVKFFRDIYGHNEAKASAPARLPPDFLPIGTILQRTSGILLMNLGDNLNGSVWAWEVSHDVWGLGENTTLGFIAPDLQGMFDAISFYTAEG